ncbi:MAG: NAD-dependent epimerase/dehydratase family protein [Sandaracinaceae bacterium]|nr:NAD-dependent epimerase/dehydratase family protein [Sandaracinaceae bacterium]
MTSNASSRPAGSASSATSLAQGASSRPSKRPRPRRIVAVTGAASYLGRNLVGLLEEDPSVSKIIVLDIQNPTTAGKKTRFYKIDLTQPAVDSRLSEIFGAEEVDVVVHLAFLSSPSTATAWAHELESVGTMHVLNACREKRISKFIMRSETFLYGPHSANPNFLTEKHPTLGIRNTSFLKDKIDAEKEARKFAASNPHCCVSILRFAPIVGPTVHNYITKWLSRPLVPTVMGFDPLVQFVHEMDAVAALLLAIARDVPGTFNIAGEGVLPLSTAVKLTGRSTLPMPEFVLRGAVAMLWAAGLVEAPSAFISYLRHLCVADGELAAVELGFRPAYTTREAVLDFGGAMRLRDARLLQEGQR